MGLDQQRKTKMWNWLQGFGFNVLRVLTAPFRAIWNAAARGLTD
jgi:hypothetical protein